MGLSDLDDSIEVIRKLQECRQAPIFVLSVRGGPPDQVHPASSRSTSDADTTGVRIGDVTVDLVARRAIRSLRQADTAKPAAAVRPPQAPAIAAASAPIRLLS